MKQDYKVLFVEDEDIVRENYMGILNNLFTEVYEAKDGLIAYKVYKEKQPDIMIIDINLPVMNGLDFLKKVRETDHDTKAILLTAHSEKETLLQASILKLTQYLIKPVRRKEFKDALELAVLEIKNFNISSTNIFNLKDNYYWNFTSKQLYKNLKKINLTKSESIVLNALLSNKSMVGTYEELIYLLWDNSNEKSINSLKTFIVSLRKKLPQDTILNEYGIGYRVNNNND